MCWEEFRGDISYLRLNSANMTDGVKLTNYRNCVKATHAHLMYIAKLAHGDKQFDHKPATCVPH